jgi:phage tail sheath protein FI
VKATRVVVIVVGAVAVAVAAKKKRRRSGYRSPGVYVEEVPSSQLPIAGVGTSIAAFRKRLKRAREAYSEAVASGAKPIEGVGTAVAVFVGLAPGGPVSTP